MDDPLQKLRSGLSERMYATRPDFPVTGLEARRLASSIFFVSLLLPASLCSRDFLKDENAPPEDSYSQLNNAGHVETHSQKSRDSIGRIQGSHRSSIGKLLTLSMNGLEDRTAGAIGWDGYRAPRNPDNHSHAVECELW
ncbi:hypothetical protein HETIRDRAFT_384798 [Heterobasidion irregulare TC 32-1]|uniref:Uncharacterized protein n=1 Tax=Heterobasidion irregulare (strain TC 32-1) TaxID=747525 RepID=W4K4J7_HETIT|nr:uncharacterized protein HETIRDRAFT_384798 [Heterobasidion irregulare TC 32-1]ETW80265.1 hypothetical protein HETIRDRAFT_384798 [Heterobasidion irregulare TC 32-1]